MLVPLLLCVCVVSAHVFPRRAEQPVFDGKALPYSAFEEYMEVRRGKTGAWKRYYVVLDPVRSTILLFKDKVSVLLAFSSLRVPKDCIPVVGGYSFSLCISSSVCLSVFVCVSVSVYLSATLFSPFCCFSPLHEVAF